MTFSVKKRKREHLVVLGEEITIAHAQDLYLALVPLIQSKRALTVDASRVQNLHTSILQLLLAAKCSTDLFRITDPSSYFEQAAQRVGLILN